MTFPDVADSELVCSALARMEAAPPFLTDEEWELLASYNGPIVSGDPLGWVPKSKPNEGRKKDGHHE